MVLAGKVGLEGRRRRSWPQRSACKLARRSPQGHEVAKVPKVPKPDRKGREVAKVAKDVETAKKMDKLFAA